MHDFNYPNIAGIAAAPKPQGPGWRRGLTLIEMLVATLIMVIVAAAAFSLFKLSATYDRHQQELMTQTQNLRAALYAISRDVRMAGSGIPMIGSPVIYIYVDDSLVDPDVQNAGVGNGWFTYAGETDTGVRAIYGNNSGKDEEKSDSLTIFRSELESTFSLGRLREDFTPGNSSTLSLQEDVIVESTFTSGDILAIADGLKTVIVQATTAAGKDAAVRTLSVGPRFEPKRTMPGGGHTFQSGSQVYNLRDVTFVTYYVDNVNHRLMANYHDVTLTDEDADDSAKKHLVTVADNIEDFQVAYFLSQLNSQDFEVTGDISLDALNNRVVVQAVQVALVSRSKLKSQLKQSDSSIEIMTHLDEPTENKFVGHKAKDEKGYTRRVMSEIIKLRNF